MEGFNQSNSESEFQVESDGRVSFPLSYCEFFPEAEKIGKRAYLRSTPEELLRRKISFTHAENWYPDLEEVSSNGRILTWESVLIPFDNSPFEIVEKVDEAIGKLGGSCFIRLNSLSPKHFEPVTSGDEAATILYESERTRQTFGLFRNLVMVRKFERFLKEAEFRLFVRKGKLRAISRYDPYCSTPLKISAQKLQTIFQRFFRCLQTESLVLFDLCTIDCVYWPEQIDRSYFSDGVFLIEFNTFGSDSVSGSCLFDWEADKQILYHGKGEIRI